MEIVKATVQHLDELLEFARDNFLLTYGHMNTKDNMRDYLQTTFSYKSFQYEFLDPESDFYVILLGNKIIGYYKSNVGDAQTEDNLPNSLELERVYVTDSLKGQGLGRKMIDHAIAQAKSKNLDFIWLGVWEKNQKAIAFYEKMGFKSIGTHVFQLGDDAQTDLIMKLEL